MATEAALLSGPTAVPAAQPDAPALEQSAGDTSESSFFSSMDKMAGNETPEPPKKEAPKQEVKKDAPKVEQKKEEAKPPVKTEAKKEEAKTEPAKPVTDAPKPKLSEVLHEREKEVKTLKAEIEKLKTSKVSADDPEKQSLIKERDQLKKRTQELEEEFKYVDYEKSPEFNEKFKQPYESLQRQLMAEAQELVVENPDGTARALTAEEFWHVATQTDLNSAVKATRELFPDEPDKRNILLGYRTQIKRSWDAMNAAKSEFRTTGAQRQAQKQAEQKAQFEQSTKAEQAARLKELEATKESEPEWTRPGDDEKEKATYAESERIVDEALFGDKKISPKMQARLRHAAVSYPLLKERYSALLTKLESAEEKLKGFEKSEPAGGAIDTSKDVVKSEDMFDRLDKIAR